jgi:hypothetical protein
MNIIYCNGVITKLLPAKHLNQALGDKVILSLYDTIILYKLYKIKLVILFFYYTILLLI